MSRLSQSLLASGMCLGLMGCTEHEPSPDEAMNAVVAPVAPPPVTQEIRLPQGDLQHIVTLDDAAGQTPHRVQRKERCRLRIPVNVTPEVARTLRPPYIRIARPMKNGKLFIGQTALAREFEETSSGTVEFVTDLRMPSSKGDFNIMVSIANELLSVAPVQIIE